MVRGNRVDVKRGQLGWSILSLSKRWRWDHGTIKRYLNFLVGEGMIAYKCDSRTTLITISNYNKWQDNTTADATTETKQKQNRSDTYNNVKNVKNEKKTTITMPLTGMDKSFASIKKKTDEPIFWKETVAFIDRLWFAKKQTKFFWKGQYFKQLKSMVNIYQPWGVMALWKVFLNSNDEWVVKTGYSFDAFSCKIPVLVDDPYWKNKAKEYQEVLYKNGGTNEVHSVRNG